MKEKKLVRVVLLVAMLVCAAAIVTYYWQHETLDAIIHVPMYVMIVALVYILIQILKRSLYKEQRWYDWLYYIGLIAIMLPPVLANEGNASIFHLLTDFGTLFLIVPVLLEGKVVVNGK